MNTINRLQPQPLSIDSIVIRQDSEGRYCLNDLHKAAGGNSAIKPGNWTRLAQFHQLADELKKCSEVSIYPYDMIPGQQGGTYVVKELVYAYAMWISPKFHLKVIPAYDTLVTKGVAVHESAVDDLLQNPLKYLEGVRKQAKEIQAERDAAQALSRPPIRQTLGGHGGKSRLLIVRYPLRFFR